MARKNTTTRENTLCIPRIIGISSNIIPSSPVRNEAETRPRTTPLRMFIRFPVSYTHLLAAAYGFSRFRFKGRFPLFWLYILMILLPFQATVVPQYLTLKALGLLGGGGSVIWPNLFATFGTFLMVQYMKNRCV